MNRILNRNNSNLLCRDCEEFNVLGFDCEWVHNRRPVALLQLSTARSNIYLIRLCKIQSVPPHLKVSRHYLRTVYTYVLIVFVSYLKDLLENIEILKVGVDILREDARKLRREYDVIAKGLFDIRFLARECGAIPNKFAKNGKFHCSIFH